MRQSAPKRPQRPQGHFRVLVPSPAYHLQPINFTQAWATVGRFRSAESLRRPLPALCPSRPAVLLATSTSARTAFPLPEAQPALLCCIIQVPLAQEALMYALHRRVVPVLHNDNNNKFQDSH